MALLLRPNRLITIRFTRSLASLLPCKVIRNSNKSPIGYHSRVTSGLSYPFLSCSKPFTAKSENSDLSMRISCQDCSLPSSQGKKLEFKCTKMPVKDFCTFMDAEPKAEIVAFFREIAAELENNRKILDFHMRIVNSEEMGFKVEVYYGIEKSGPVVLPLSRCISCHPNVPIFPGQEPVVEARECILEEFSSHPYAICRIDGKGRCGFVITPIRHVDRMSELDDEELYGLWSLAVQVLRQTHLPFTTMILNHGTYRNVEHLHLKIWVERSLYEQYLTQWTDERQELWLRLQELALKRPKKGLRLKNKV